MKFYKHLTPFKKELFKILSTILLITIQIVGGYVYCVYNFEDCELIFSNILFSTLAFIFFEVAGIIISGIVCICIIIL